MAMTLVGTKTALLPGLTASFAAAGGTAPYSYSVVQYQPGVTGAGGSIDPVSGLYTAPASMPLDPRNFYDQVVATDSSNPPVTAKAFVMIGQPWMLVGEIILRVLGLPIDRLWFWKQKVQMPKDPGLFIAISIPHQKPFSSGNFPSGQTTQNGPGADLVTKYSAVQATLDIHLYSRNLEALNRLPEVFMALAGPYSETQQETNGFYLAKLPHNAVDMSEVDGDAIPYHYVVTVEMMYTVTKQISPDYYSTVAAPTITTNP
jgi:hypothetical protein